jgi:hypothetical protein
MHLRKWLTWGGFIALLAIILSLKELILVGKAMVEDVPDVPPAQAARSGAGSGTALMTGRRELSDPSGPASQTPPDHRTAKRPIGCAAGLAFGSTVVFLAIGYVINHLAPSVSIGDAAAVAAGLLCVVGVLLTNLTGDGMKRSKAHVRLTWFRDQRDLVELTTSLLTFISLVLIAA